MFKVTLKRSLLGAVLGVFISQALGIFISACINDGAYYAVVPELTEMLGNEVLAVFVQTVCSLIYGAVFGGASVIWEKDNWSILKQTVIHFVIVSAVTFPVAYITGWMEHSVLGVLVYYVIFATTYAFIWFSQYMAMRKRIKELNSKVKELA